MFPSVWPGACTTRAPPPKSRTSPSTTPVTRDGRAKSPGGSRRTACSCSGRSQSSNTGGGPGTSPRTTGASAVCATTSAPVSAATSRAPPAWSSWKWVSTSRRTRPAARAASAMRAPYPAGPASISVTSSPSRQRYA